MHQSTAHKLCWLSNTLSRTALSLCRRCRSEQQAFIDIRLRSGRAHNWWPTLSAAKCQPLPASRPLQPNVRSSIKPEVHNAAQRLRRRTEPRPQGICTQNFVHADRSCASNFVLADQSCASRDTLADRQTHKQTHRHSDRQITILRSLHP